VTGTTYKFIYDLLETLPVVSSHEHHGTDDFQVGLTLDGVLAQSYVGWLDVAPGSDAVSRADFLAQCRHNSYYVWLEKGIRRVHGVDEVITARNWEEISRRISCRHAEPGAHIRILTETGRYRRAVQDSYWDYGSDVGHPELFSPTMRTDMFVRCFHPGVLDHDENNPFAAYPDAPTQNFDDYLDYLRDLFTGWRERGAVALKSASAYERSLAYGSEDRPAAAAVFGRRPESVGPTERAVFESTLFHFFCRLAASLDVPFQVHTGLGELAGSNPLALEPVLIRHPDVRFVLFHAGYPWCGEAAGLAHNHGNISLDMVWAPVISTTAAIAALHEFIEVARSSDRIAWGSDTWTSEEAVGALLGWQHVVATVLSEKVEAGYLELEEAEVLAHKLMYRNAAHLYGFDVH
jgi:predicted TIM-barrel fold metal-dependent hydrolase